MVIGCHACMYVLTVDKDDAKNDNDQCDDAISTTHEDKVNLLPS
jgi:hypothetical protein